MAFKQPSMRRGRPKWAKPFNLIDKKGVVYVIKDLERFCELTGLNAGSLRQVKWGRLSNLRGLSLYDGPLEGKEVHIVDEDTEE